MMVGSTLLFFSALVMVWEAPLVLAVTFLAVFGLIDTVYLSANLNKVPNGARLPWDCFACPLPEHAVILDLGFGEWSFI